jgi:hypothetical protein
MQEYRRVWHKTQVLARIRSEMEANRRQFERRPADESVMRQQ